MKFLMNKLEWIIDRFCTILLTLMVIVCFIQVINRYVFGQAFFWAEELTLYALIWTTFLGAAIAVRQEAHTRIDFFVNLLPPKGVKIMNLIANFLCLIYVLTISYLSITVVKMGLRIISIGLQIPKGIAFLALPVGGLLMATYLALRIIEQIRSFNTIDEGGSSR